jgi:hypothetical protein
VSIVFPEREAESTLGLPYSVLGQAGSEHPNVSSSSMNEVTRLAGVLIWC